MVAFHNPFDRPLHFLGLELVVMLCFALCIHHAVSRWRRGERHHLFQLVAIFLYGITMELIAFHYYQNYVHGQFTVQLYRGLLPLYVTAIYIVFHYTGIKLAERLGLGAVAEALIAGFAICLLDVPFDIMGVDAGWWAWSTEDQVIAARWLGVPVTSYYWYMVFGAILTGLCRALRGRSLAWTPAVAIGTFVLGVAAFLPFHGLTALGVPAGAVVAAHMGGCAVLALLARGDARAASPALAAIPVALVGYHLAVLFALWPGGIADGPIKLAAIGGAAAGLAVIAFGTARSSDPAGARA